MAEQMSCTKPGWVSSALREPPPTVVAASITSTERPACASTIAADKPLGRPDHHRVILGARGHGQHERLNKPASQRNGAASL